MAGKIIVLLALLAVAGILVAGVVVMAIGGDTAKKYSNVLMRYRVLAQAVAILVVLMVLYLGSHH